MTAGTVLASTAGYAYAGGAEAEGAAAGSPGVASGNTVQVPLDAPVNVCGNTVDVVGLLNPAYGNQCGNTSAPAHHGGGSQAGGGSQNGGSQGGTGSQTGGGQNGGDQSGGGQNSGGQNSGGQNGPGTPGIPGVPPPPVAGSSASGATQGSPGVGSGNNGQLPVSVPVNACGDSVDVVGLLNPAMGNDCVNHQTPGHPQAPPPVGSTPAAPVSAPTGSVAGVTGTRTSAQPPAAAPVAAPVVQQAPAAPQQAPAAATHLAYTGVDGLDVLAPAGLALLVAGGVLYRRAARSGA
ncbi:chaplin [Kitasatospora sp. NPDC006697]|uniref:chaplin n=1 Tax=Kitasatospora sp. NPDC006697 TaxID=3364020 RepID=UPI0036C44C9F